MKLQKILKKLQELHPKEIDLSLNRIKILLEKLGNPQNNLKSISVVGTNGKYSTIQACFSILKEANFKCNIYTSPNILKINERFILESLKIITRFKDSFWQTLIIDFNQTSSKKLSSLNSVIFKKSDLLICTNKKS